MQQVRLLLFASLVFFSSGVVASDLAKEKRWADQVVDSLLDGDAVWLDDGKHEFLGIYTTSEETSQRAVIVIHGMGAHPNWQQVIQPLRIGLTEYNWNTLSIQMPILANDADIVDYAPLYDEVAPRIDAAIKYLHDKGKKDIVLLAHSLGSTMAAYYLSTTSHKVAGFVAIGMSGFAVGHRMNSINSLSEIRLAILDLYGKDDLRNIIASANARVLAANKSGNKDYTQLVIAGNHFFDDNEDILLSTIVNWLALRVSP